MTARFCSFLIILCAPIAVGSSVSAIAKSDDAWQALAPYFRPPAEYVGDLGPYRSPLLFEDGMPVKTAQDWPRRRAEILAKWRSDLGGSFDLLDEPKITFLENEHRGNFTEHHVLIEAGSDRKQVDGYLLVPDGDGPFPAIFVPFYEPMSSIGRGKPDTLGSIDFGLQMTRRGFVSLSIGTPGWSSKVAPNDTRSLLVAIGDEMKRQPLGYLALIAANCNTALRSLKYVDPKRIGVVGHSYGGKWSMFASCLDERFACAVWCDPGIVLDETNRNINYYEPWYVGWQEDVRRKPGPPNDESPRTGLYKTIFEHDSRELVELHALMAPRPVLVSGGSEDRPQHWRALNHLIAVNKLLGVEDRAAMTNREGHRPTPEAAAMIYAFFERFLKR